MEQKAGFFSPSWLWLPILFAAGVGLLLPHLVSFERYSHFPPENVPQLDARERLLHYDADQHTWAKLIADFPSYYHENPDKIHRPGYAAMTSVLYRLGRSVTSSDWWLAYAAGVIVNLAVLVLSVFGFRALLLRWEFSAFVADMSAAQLALLPMVVWSTGSIATYFVSIGMVVAVLWIVTWCFNSRDELRSGLIAGGVIGLLMLVKSLYETVLIGVVVLRYNRRWRQLVSLLLALFVPLIIWIGILRLMGLTYSNYEAKVFEQGTWIFTRYLHQPPYAQLCIFANFLAGYRVALLRAFGAILLPAMLGTLCMYRTPGRRWLGFAAVAFLANLLFLFALRKPVPYLASGLFFAMLPLASTGWERVAAATGLGRWSVSFCVGLTLISAHLLYIPDHIQFFVKPFAPFVFR